MADSRSRLAPLRERGAEILVAAMVIEEWEVAAMHRDHTAPVGAACRVAWLRTNHSDPDRGIGLYRTSWLPEIESIAGFCTTVGVTLDGVTIDGSAPVDLILGNYTIGVFDDCGGHVNPQEGYYMHATTGCSNAEQDVAEGETALFGYALDGYGIHAPYGEDAAIDSPLDDCNGHETDSLGYHHHANAVAENAVLTCFSGETTEAASAGPGGEGPPAGGSAPPSGGS